MKKECNLGEGKSSHGSLCDDRNNGNHFVRIVVRRRQGRIFGRSLYLNLSTRPPGKGLSLGPALFLDDICRRKGRRFADSDVRVPTNFPHDTGDFSNFLVKDRR